MAENKQFLDYEGITIVADEIKATQNSISEVSNELQRKAIPADMAQNDSTQFDYVKNRTHYIENRVNAIYSNVVTFDSTTSSKLLMVTEPIGLEVGKIYNVIWNGETYAVISDKDRNGDVAIGDTQGQGQFPFLITDAIEDYAVLVEYLGEVEEGDSLNVTFTIAENVEIIHKLDNRYLPDGVAYTTDIEENIRPYAKDVNISSTTQNVNITAATNNINLNANGNINLRGNILPIIGTGKMILESPNTTTVGANITMANENIFMVGGGRVEISKPTMIINNTEELTMVNGAMNVVSTKGINIVSNDSNSSGVNITTVDRPIQLLSNNITIGNGYGIARTTISNPTTIAANTTIDGFVTMNSSATVNGNLTVNAGRATLNKGADIHKGLSVEGDINQNGDLNTQDIYANSLTMHRGERNILIGGANFYDNIGAYNYISGENNRIYSGVSNSMVIGDSNAVSGSVSQAKAIHTFVLGSSNTNISQDNQFIVGNTNFIESSGNGTSNLTIFGNNNASNFTDNSNIFIVGANNKIGSGVKYASSCAYNSVFGANHLVEETSHHSTITGRDNISSGDAQLIGGYLNDNDENNLLEIGNGYKVIGEGEKLISESHRYNVTALQEQKYLMQWSEKTVKFKISTIANETSPGNNTVTIRFYASDASTLIFETNALFIEDLPYTINMSLYPNASYIAFWYESSTGNTANIFVDRYYRQMTEIGEVRQNAMSVSKQGVVKANDYITDMGYELVAVAGSSTLQLSNETDTEYLFTSTIDSAAAYNTTLRLHDVTAAKYLFNAPIGAGVKITVPSSVTQLMVHSWSSELNQYLPINVYKKKTDVSLKDTIKELKTITVDGVERTGILKRAKVTVSPIVHSLGFSGKQLGFDESERALLFTKYGAAAQVPITDVGITDSSKIVVLSTQTYQHTYYSDSCMNTIPMHFKCFGTLSNATEEMMIFEGTRVGIVSYNPNVIPSMAGQVGTVDLVIEYLELEDLPTTTTIVELSEEEMAAMVATLNEIDEIEEEN